tara:strand:+ start:2990 stop:3190 length:201 start_codon:yes stop_codon:yes gene_type:complete
MIISYPIYAKQNTSRDPKIVSIEPPLIGLTEAHRRPTVIINPPAVIASPEGSSAVSKSGKKNEWAK